MSILEGVLVKKAYQQLTYTLQQKQELALCADPITGPQYFLENYFYLQHPTKGRMLFKLYDFQKELLAKYNGYRLSINMCSRQLGKTQTAAGYLLWKAMFVPDQTILVASNKYSGAAEILQRIRFGYENVPDFIRAGVVTYNKGSLEFDNGSRIVGATTTETTGRGMSISLLYLDELAHVKPNIAKGFWTSISPTLSTGGSAIITSTPNTDEDQFANIWFGANKCVDEFGNETDVGVNGFKAFKATWDVHPDRDQVWADQERASLGETKFRVEHLCEFLSSEEVLIDPIKLSEIQPVYPITTRHKNTRWFEKIDKNATYSIGLDPSMGTGGDYAAIQVFNVSTMTQVAEWQHNKTMVEKQLEVVIDIIYDILDVVKNENQIYWTVENNSMGEAVLLAIREIGEENIPGNLLSDGKKRKGYNTTPQNKLVACMKFKSWIESKKIQIKSKNLISELKNYVANGRSYAAKSGETDDLIAATLLNVRMIMHLQQFNSNLSDIVDEDEFLPPMPFLALFSKN